jgi:hypothetical protein
VPRHRTGVTEREVDALATVDVDDPVAVALSSDVSLVLSTVGIAVVS